MRTIRLSGGDLGGEQILVRCNLSEASSPVEVDYCNEPGEYGQHWEGTQYQAADCQHRISRLIEIGERLAAQAVEMSEDDFSCDCEEIE